MTIYVELSDRGGNQKWVVKNGAGRGGRVISYHRTKSRAEQRARKEARKRNTDLHVQQDRGGTWAQGPGYGGER